MVLHDDVEHLAQRCADCSVDGAVASNCNGARRHESRGVVLARRVLIAAGMRQSTIIALSVLTIACSSDADDGNATTVATSATVGSSSPTAPSGDGTEDTGDADATSDDPAGSSPSDDTNDSNTSPEDDTGPPAGTCDFDMTAAIRLTVDVTWAGGIAVLEGAGAIDIWLLGELDANGGDVGLSGRVCSIALPDFETGLLAGNETYGTMFPDVVWSSPTMPTIDAQASLSSQDPGATLHLERGAVVLGATMSDPLNDAWPADWHALATTDHDGDASPGITAAAKTGGGYAYPRIDILNSEARAQAIHLVSRTTMEFNGTVDTCDSAVGDATITMENHAVGCATVGGGACSDGQTTTLDNNMPQFVVQGGSFELLRIAEGADCAAVFAALP